MQFTYKMAAKTSWHRYGAAVTVVANVEAMVIDAATGELHEGADDDDDDGDKTTIYQHGVCQ